ncbi:hypothetical protein ACP70R_001337 [Stipagrostis hirtigluma subsp. patula]
MEVVGIVSPAMPAASSASGTGGGEFTEADLAAADQLVQLSVSGGGGDEEQCSSAGSVNNAEAGGEEEDDDDAGVVDRRARKRYRLVSDLYAATRQVKAAAAGAGSKRKSKDRMEN